MTSDGAVFALLRHRDSLYTSRVMVLREHHRPGNAAARNWHGVQRMLCRACRQGADPQPSRKGEQLCSRCGQLLAPAPMMRRVRDKLVQLARFGLDATRGALLERKPRQD